MPALTSDRNTPRRDGMLYSYPVAGGVELFIGAIAVINATGFAAPASTATDLTTVGLCERQVDNSGGGDGERRVTVRRGVFLYDNSADGDEITNVHVGSDCYLVDDQTLAATDGGGTRSVAGKVHQVDDDGVWVQLG